MLHILLTHAYAIMLPLSFIEGPIVALAGGAGVAAGRLDPLFVGLIIAAGAAFQDTVFYWIGRWAQSRPRIRALAERARLLRSTVRPLEEAWRSNLFATLATSKLAYGLYGPILVTAGMADVPFTPFLLESLALSAIVLGAWFAFGFGLQRIYGAVGHESLATYLMIGSGIVGLIALFFVARHARQRLCE